MSTLSDKDRNELSLLLPWYANGTLDAADSQRVEAALAEDDALAREFDLVLEDQAAMVELVSEEEVPSSISERFKAQLNAEMDKPAPRSEAANTQDGFLSRLITGLFPAQPRAYAAAAIMAAVVIPAVALVSYQAGNDGPAQYQTASGEDPVAPDAMRVLVRFNAAADWASIDAFLQEKGGQIVNGPTPDGFYELEFKSEDGLAEELNAVTDIFEFALPAN